jgi:hypothetical protein
MNLNNLMNGIKGISKNEYSVWSTSRQDTIRSLHPRALGKSCDPGFHGKRNQVYFSGDFFRYARHVGMGKSQPDIEIKRCA